MKRLFLIFLTLVLCQPYGAAAEVVCFTFDNQDACTANKDSGCVWQDNSCSKCINPNYQNSTGTECYKKIEGGKKFLGGKIECEPGYQLNDTEDGCEKVVTLTIKANVSEIFRPTCGSVCEEKQVQIIKKGFNNKYYLKTENKPLSDYLSETYNRRLMAYNGIAASAADCQAGKFLMDKAGSQEATFDYQSRLVYVCWENDFQITYQSSLNKKDTQSKTCNPGTNWDLCTEIMPSVPSDWPHSGTYLKQYNCSSHGKDVTIPSNKIGETSLSWLIDSLDGVDNYSNTLTCTVEFDTCGRGYYCDDTGRYPCPPGSTTIGQNAEQAKAITECYITQETVFQDSKGSFKLLEKWGLTEIPHTAP